MVLLVVVSILTLFLMVGVTYVLIAGHYHNSSTQNQRAKRYGDEPEREMEEVIGQVLFGSVNSTSMIAPHNLLADLYGNDLVYGQVVSGGVNPALPPLTTPLYSGQGIVLRVQLFGVSQPNPIPNYYAGRVVTFTNGSAAGISTRIMAYFPAGIPAGGASSNQPELIVEAPESDLPIPVTPSPLSAFIINGAPFNGTGAGYNNTTGELDLRVDASGNIDANATSFPVALLPGYASRYPLSATVYSQGSLDEPYDAADFQNMFLSYIPARPGNGTILPSFHRPDLVNYWVSQGADASTVAGQQLLSQVILRPMPWDHLNFSGSNPAFNGQANAVSAMINGPWDVDCDGDNIAESVWVDPGLPVVTAPSGRRYKRLVAICIKDLDGRINVNAHGNVAPILVQAARTSYQFTDAFAGVNPSAAAPIAFIPRGQGFGPAEIDFMHLFGSYGNATELAAYQSLILNRYGLNEGNNPQPGEINTDDMLSMIKTIGIPTDHTNPPFSSYSTPPDVWGRGAFALDYYGQPLWMTATGVGSTERVDDPYELKVYGSAANLDSPYSVSDGEALLRYHDLGAQTITTRLVNSSTQQYLAPLLTEPPGTIGTSHYRREVLTTHSSSLPVPKIAIPREQRLASPGLVNATILDLYTLRIAQGLSMPIPFTPSDGQYPEFVRRFNTIVPFELHRGQLFNINRELGNGQSDQDNNGVNNGTVDDPSELIYPPYPLQPGSERVWNNPSLAFEHLNDSVPPYVPSLVNHRQIYARQLYCLAMLLKNQSQQLDTDGDGTPNTAPESAEMIAQWAINVVDFRDADSICTAFEYDATPFDADGWNVDGDPSTTGDQAGGNGIVWGCERPELLLTEGIAWHDRRTEDKDDTGNGMTDGPEKDNLPNTMDPNDFDQRLQPRGACFIEVYNPWFDQSNGAYGHKAPELYSNIGANGGVELHRVNAQGTPVWRMLIIQGASKNGVDPDSPRPEQLTGSADIDRSVYFANQTLATSLPSSGDGAEVNPNRRFFPPDTITPAPILPGRYAVIGSADAVNGNVYSTYVGRTTTATEGTLELNRTRRIELRPNTDPAIAQVRVFDNSKPYTNDPQDNDFSIADVQATVAIPITQPRSLSLTVPIDGYPGVIGGSIFDPTLADGEGAYAPEYDTPLDQAVELRTNQTTGGYRTIHLQRLANPLLAWDRFTNPYITIDTSSIDLTAFNGVADDSAFINPGGNRNFQTCQRGGSFPAAEVSSDYPDPPASRGARNLWLQENARSNAGVTQAIEAGGVGPHHFPYELHHTFGYLNRRFHPYFDSTSGVAAAYYGAPNHQNAAFPWLTFSNRPFNNPMELLLATCRSQSQLLVGFGMRDPAQPWANAYSNSNTLAPYSHLLNFFQTESALGAGDAPELSRLLDFVEVPSPFVGTEKYYNPQYFSTGNDPAICMRPPFNRLSRFRDPGRVNINTFADAYEYTGGSGQAVGSDIFQAVAKGFPGIDPAVDNGAFLQRLLLSRQGYGTTIADILTRNPNYPSIFSQPFRTADSSDLVPPAFGTGANLSQRPAEGGLLRRDNNYAAIDANDADKPLFASGTQLAFQDADRNPYFRYQAMQKVGNLFSTNSNCYAVWITMGYFEVEGNDADNDPATPATIDAAHPDGLRLAQEVGVDTGEVKRHRAFYIIDRSIPVGYEPGHRHNTDKAVLLKRFIE
ncbi:MAG: hypothetical protein ACR2FY_00990 [Pirellulaceae bacterium]